MRPAALRSALAGLALLLMACAAFAQDKPGSAIFLVARHDMPDPNFHDSVVVVTQQGAGAPVGLIVNKPTTIALSTVFPEIAALRGRGDVLFYGGPVSRQQLFIVFRAAKPPDDEDAIELIEGVYMSMSGEVIKQIVSSGAPPERFRIFAGYAGWAPMQLQAEVGRGDWHLARPDAATIFSASPEKVWRELFRSAAAVKARYLLRQRYQPATLSATKTAKITTSRPMLERLRSCGS